MVLTPPERRELKRRARNRSLAVELVKRTEGHFDVSSGHSYRDVRQRLDCSDEYYPEWKRRFQRRTFWPDSIRAIAVVNAGTRTAEAEARILEATPSRVPPTVRAHWSSYRLAKELALVSRA